MRTSGPPRRDPRSPASNTSVEELTSGAFSVAAPVRDATGTVVAAVSIVARVERKAEPQFALGVRMAARGISAALGLASGGSDHRLSFH